jgi:hypothetical protein
MKQTAVEWLIEKLTNKQNGVFDGFPYLSVDEIYEQAKEMEKENIQIAFDDGDYNYHYSRKTGNDFENGEEYFKELYGGNK